jgi:SAM-dependent methyltransferase
VETKQQQLQPVLAPGTFEQIVDELTDLLDGSTREIIAERVWREALAVGTNVVAASQGKITPHQYDSRMEDFYRSTDAFVIETIVESQRPGKQAVMQRIVERIRLKMASAAGPLEVLMLGDGSGGDTILLAREFGSDLRLTYFDVPGSITFQCAMKRFARAEVEPTIITSYEAIPKKRFDVLLSLEVLEHLPDPVRAAGDMRTFLKPDGIALVTESFNGVKPQFPTHLTSNLKYNGLQYVMFARQGFAPTYSHGKPMELLLVERVFSRLMRLHPKLAVKYVLSMFLGPLRKSGVRQMIRT